MAGAMFTYVDAPGVYKRYFLYPRLAIGVLLLFGMVYVFWPRASVSTVVLNFGGMPIDLRPVEWQDVECVGAPDGHQLFNFADQSDEYGKHITVGYAREGDD